MDVQRKLEILADAAKYDASCASSGTEKRDSRDGKGLGSTDAGMGICHSYAPDGRCISLLKILLTNACNYDCLYCVNRATSNVPRARFTVDEVVQLTLDFYRRNYIEGLFLSSGIIRSADYTMEQVVSVARKLARTASLPRLHSPEDHSGSRRRADCGGRQICRPAQHQHRGAGGREPCETRAGEGRARDQAHHGPVAAQARRGKRKYKSKNAPRFAPAGQSTQMIVGADSASDQTILNTSANLYGSYNLKRVYYSAFSPIPDASRSLPLQRAAAGP